jgi:type III restriction enzyme
MQTRKLELKPYQRRTLETLKCFLEATRLDSDPKAAYDEVMQALEAPFRPYLAIDGLEKVPYVCVRIPTGGGKTLLAAHTVETAASAYLEQDFPVVLWLVPTNTIRSQTLDALKQPKHPYREAIDKAFDGRVVVFDIAEIETIRPQDLTERVCVIVGTLATLRVDKTEGRRIYSHNENYESHFSRVSPNTPGLERIEEGLDKGKIKFSFANLLHLHKPLVIMDEAHNARTSLTFEVLQRISPACVVEFTATPDSTRSSGSNVICRVSAAELKGEEMIKLPIILKEHKNWQEAIRDAVLTRKRLEELAAADVAFIRPIALIQAESKEREVTVEVVLKHLTENELIPRERIAVATGNQRELDGIDLFDRACKVEYVVTVEALKEGWDCSFAYVFCSAANIHSGKDVEQLLGRVLRMPYAQRRTQEELNRAYAFVTSPNFAHAANDLHDRLVSMGFEEEEASEFIQAAQPPLIPEEDLPLWGHREPEPLVVTCGDGYKPEWIEREAPQGIALERGDNGELRLTVTGAISDELEERIVAAAPKAAQAELRKTIVSHRRYVQKSLSPSERGEHFSAPRLCVAIQGELELAEKELFLDARGWSLLDFPHALPSAEIAVDEGARTFEFDIRGKKVVFGLLSQEQQLDLSHVNTDWNEAQFVRWLDKAARQPDVRQEVMLEFLRRTVADLRERLRLEMAVLVRCRFILAKLLVEKIKGFRQEACARGFQDTLFGPQATVETSFEYAFNYDPNVYPANWYYQGRFDLSKKHYYPMIGELKGKGEEFECACAIATLKEVKQWVRNLAIQPRASFWLPTSTDRFYPDFVAELCDGRILVVEYKGEGYKTNDDSKEKRQIGQLWEEKSNGRGLFIMAVERDAQGCDVHRQLAEKVRRGNM